MSIRSYFFDMFKLFFFTLNSSKLILLREILWDLVDITRLFEWLKLNTKINKFGESFNSIDKLLFSKCIFIP